MICIVRIPSNVYSGVVSIVVLRNIGEILSNVGVQHHELELQIVCLR